MSFRTFLSFTIDFFLLFLGDDSDVDDQSNEVDISITKNSSDSSVDDLSHDKDYKSSPSQDRSDNRFSDNQSVIDDEQSSLPRTPPSLSPDQNAVNEIPLLSPVGSEHSPGPSTNVRDRCQPAPNNNAATSSKSSSKWSLRSRNQNKQLINQDVENSADSDYEQQEDIEQPSDLEQLSTSKKEGERGRGHGRRRGRGRGKSRDKGIILGSAQTRRGRPTNGISKRQKKGTSPSPVPRKIKSNTTDNTQSSSTAGATEKSTSASKKKDDDGWKNERRTEPRNFEFTGSPGIKIFPYDRESPLSVLHLFLPDTEIEKFVLHTNKNANTLIQNPALHVNLNEKSRSIFKSWKDTNKNEIWVYIAVCLLMGVIKKPEYDFHWTNDLMFQNPIFPRLTSRRFKEIRKMIHFQSLWTVIKIILSTN